MKSEICTFESNDGSTTVRLYALDYSGQGSVKIAVESDGQFWTSGDTEETAYQRQFQCSVFVFHSSITDLTNLHAMIEKGIDQIGACGECEVVDEGGAKLTFVLARRDDVILTVGKTALTISYRSLRFCCEIVLIVEETVLRIAESGLASWLHQYSADQ